MFNQAHFFKVWSKKKIQIKKSGVIKKIERVAIASNMGCVCLNGNSISFWCVMLCLLPGLLLHLLSLL